MEMGPGPAVAAVSSGLRSAFLSSCCHNTERVACKANAKVQCTPSVRVGRQGKGRANNIGKWKLNAHT